MDHQETNNTDRISACECNFLNLFFLLFYQCLLPCQNKVLLSCGKHGMVHYWIKVNGQRYCLRSNFKSNFFIWIQTPASGNIYFTKVMLESTVYNWGRATLKSNPNRVTLPQASLTEGILHHLDLKTHRECSVDGETLHAKLHIKNLMQYISAVCHLVCSVHIKLITCLSILEESFPCSNQGSKNASCHIRYRS